MNLLDLIIIATMVYLVFRGIFRGFFREIGSLAGVILGIWLAGRYQPQMTEYLKAYLPPGAYLSVLGFASVFLIVLVCCNLAGWGLKMIFKKALLGWADRGLGAGFAVVKGIIITYLVIVLLTFFVPSQTPLIAGSKLAPLIVSSYQSMVSIISPDSYQKLKKRFLSSGRDMAESIKGKAVGAGGKNGTK